MKTDIVEMECDECEIKEHFRVGIVGDYDGWWAVREMTQAGRQERTFCSLKCVEAWARRLRKPLEQLLEARERQVQDMIKEQDIIKEADDD